MSDITNPNFFILVTEGPLVGPFFSEEDAKSWAENAGMAYKRIDRVKHYSTFPREMPPDTRQAAH